MLCRGSPTMQSMSPPLVGNGSPTMQSMSPPLVGNGSPSREQREPSSIARALKVFHLKKSFNYIQSEKDFTDEKTSLVDEFG